jgi:hypothetical protein
MYEFILNKGTSILQLFVEPELKTNMPVSRVLHSHAPEECVYEPEGTGVMVKKGEEVCFTLRQSFYQGYFGSCRRAT